MKIRGFVAVAHAQSIYCRQRPGFGQALCTDDQRASQSSFSRVQRGIRGGGGGCRGWDLDLHSLEEEEEQPLLPQRREEGHVSQGAIAHGVRSIKARGPESFMVMNGSKQFQTSTSDFGNAGNTSHGARGSAPGCACGGVGVVGKREGHGRPGDLSRFSSHLQQSVMTSLVLSSTVFDEALSTWLIWKAREAHARGSCFFTSFAKLTHFNVR